MGLVPLVSCIRSRSGLRRQGVGLAGGRSRRPAVLHEHDASPRAGAAAAASRLLARRRALLQQLSQIPVPVPFEVPDGVSRHMSAPPARRQPLPGARRNACCWSGFEHRQHPRVNPDSGPSRHPDRRGGWAKCRNSATPKPLHKRRSNAGAGPGGLKPSPSDPAALSRSTPAPWQRPRQASALDRLCEPGIPTYLPGCPRTLKRAQRAIKLCGASNRP